MWRWRYVSGRQLHGFRHYKVTSTNSMLCWIPWMEIKMQEHEVKAHFMRAARVTLYVCTCLVPVFSFLALLEAINTERGSRWLSRRYQLLNKTRRSILKFYSAVDTNPLSVYIMQPIWNKIIKIVPLWIAPNLLTFSGFVMILFNYFLISFYDWDYTASGTSPGLVPTWVWLFSAFTTFCAYALDSIDGKHARRTQSSSPLGELFDHGLDSWATSIFVLSFFSVCSRDNGKTGVSVYTMYIYLSIVLFNFMCSHWEKYNTGVLFLPWGYDISQVVLIAAYLLTGTVGVEVWQKPLLFGYYITDVLVILLIGFSLFLSFPQTLYNIHRAHLKKTLKNDSLYEGLLPLVSPLLLFVLLTVWVVLSPNNILAKQPRLFLWMVGVAFSNVICKVIICQMSSTRPELFHWFLFPLALVVYAAISGLLGSMEEAVLGVFTALLTAAHVHYGVCVGRQLSEHLNIYIFSLKKRVQE